MEDFLGTVAVSGCFTAVNSDAPEKIFDEATLQASKLFPDYSHFRLCERPGLIGDATVFYVWGKK